MIDTTLSDAQMARLESALTMRSALGPCERCGGKVAVGTSYLMCIKRNSALGRTKAPARNEELPTSCFSAVVCTWCGHTNFHSLDVLGIRE